MFNMPLLLWLNFKLLSCQLYAGRGMFLSVERKIQGHSPLLAESHSAVYPGIFSPLRIF